jgi:hypothetical protein
MLALIIFILGAVHICCNNLTSTTYPVDLIMPQAKSSSKQMSNAKLTALPESPPAQKSKATPVPLSKEETDVLSSHLDEWNRNKGKARRQIKEAAIAEARLIAPKMEKKLLKLRPQVSLSGAGNSAFAKLTGSFTDVYHMVVQPW